MRPSFGLKHIWIVVSALAVVTVTVHKNGVVAGSFAVLSLLCMAGGIRMFRTSHLLFAGILCISASICGWFATVDRSFYAGQCPHCRADVSEERIQVLGWPLIQRQFEINNPIALIASDLGVPCSHPELQLELQQRFLGLEFCSPCLNGIDGIYGELSWYDNEARKYVRDFARQHAKKW